MSDDTDNSTDDSADLPFDQDLPETVESLLEKYGSRIFWLIRSRLYGPLQDHADDVYQEFSSAVFRAFHTYDRTLPPLPWLMAIARRECIDFLRYHRRREIPHSDPVAVEDLVDPYDDLPFESDETQAMRECLAELEQSKRAQGGEEQRADQAKMIQTLVDMYLHGMSTDAIVERDDVPPGTVHSRIARAKKKLAECIVRRLGRKP